MSSTQVDLQPPRASLSVSSTRPPFSAARSHTLEHPLYRSPSPSGPLLTSLLRQRCSPSLAMPSDDPSLHLALNLPPPTQTPSSMLLDLMKRPTQLYPSTSHPDPSLRGPSWEEGRPWWTERESELELKPGSLLSSPFLFLLYLFSPPRLMMLVG